MAFCDPETGICEPITDPFTGGPPPPLPTPTIPHIGNPIPYAVHGAEAEWSDVASWVSDAWHGITGFFTGGFTMGWDEVKNLIDIALSYEQTAWASFVSTLESWINASVSALEAAISDAATFAMTLQANLLGVIAAEVDYILRDLLNAVYGIDQALAKQWWDTVAAIDNAEANLRTWAIDNIYHPLLVDVLTAAGEIYDTIKWDVASIEGQLSNITDIDIPALLAKLGLITAAITAIESWVNDCGEPMCQQMGPNTDWSKLLKVLNVAGMLALLTSVGALTEAQLEQLAATIASIGTDPASAFVDAFVTEGDTLATAIANAIPQLAL